MTDKEAKIWKEGFEAGAKSVQRQNDKAIKIGSVIIDTLYEIFEPAKEDY
jgi:hypothetical protein